MYIYSEGVQAKTSLPIGLLQKYGKKIFFETGTNVGHGVELAESLEFEKIISIDLDQRFVDIAKEKFKHNKNIEIYYGDSKDILFDLIKDFDEEILFWLDGHDDVSGRPAPLIEELQQIGRHKIKTHTILIDDVRMMGSIEWGRLEFGQIEREALKINDEYKTCITDSASFADDVLVFTTGPIPDRRWKRTFDALKSSTNLCG